MKIPLPLIPILTAMLVTSAAAESAGRAAETGSTPAALRLDMATFLGGKGEDRANGMAVDGQGNIYLTAPIESKDFPTTPDALNKTATGIYLAKLSPAGAVLYSTFLGAAGGNNYAHGVALDKEGCIYIAGNTTNRNFPVTSGAFQTTFTGPSNTSHGDGFVVKLSPTGDRIIYATLIGGTAPDICGKIAVDSSGNAYVLGCTSSADFPVTTGAFQTALKSKEEKPTGRGDLFLAKLSPDGSKLVYCTYVGGSGMDIYSNNLILNPSGSVTFAGETTSPDFPVTANAFEKTYRGGSSGPRGGGDGVVVTLNPTGTALEYASFIGGSGDDRARSIALDNEGNIWVAGDTTSADFPTTTDAWCRQNKGAGDCFFLKLNPRGGTLLYSSLLGGAKVDQSAAIVVHHSGQLVVTGRTESVDFPVTSNAVDSVVKGPADLFIALFDPAAKTLRYCTLLGGSGNEVPGPLMVSKDDVYFAGNTTSADFPVIPGVGGTTYNGGKNEWGGDAFVARFALVGADQASLATTPATGFPILTGDYLGQPLPGQRQKSSRAGSCRRMTLSTAHLISLLTATRSSGSRAVAQGPPTRIGSV